MKKKEASARIKINHLLEEAGWRFFDDENGPANFYTSSSINSYINWGLLGIARCVGKNDGKGVDEIYNLPLESLLKIEGGK